MGLFLVEEVVLEFPEGVPFIYAVDGVLYVEVDQRAQYLDELLLLLDLAQPESTHTYSTCIASLLSSPMLALSSAFSLTRASISSWMLWATLLLME